MSKRLNAPEPFANPVPTRECLAHQHKISSIQPFADAERDDRRQESNQFDFFSLVRSFLVQARPGFGSKGISTSESLPGVAEATTAEGLPKLQALLNREDILHLQSIVRKVLIGRSMSAYAVRLVRATRPNEADAPDFVKKYLTWGAGPRACQSILLGAKANALLDGRVNVSSEDIRYVIYPVLRHRLVTSFTAESDGLSTDDLIHKLIDVIREE